MLWEDKAILFSVLLVYSSSQVLASGERQEDVECAELNSTGWQGYRQQRPKLEVQYLLLTRKNPDCAQRFDQDSLSMPTSYFNTSRPTKVIVHGYRALGRKPSWVTDLAQALLRAQDVNVVVVDWIYGASFAYNLVVENYKEVALQISVLINQLQTHGCQLESFHFIGVSLGAHVSGFVGTLFEGKIGRITGLDPAGPMFKGADTYDRLDPTDALFVEAIHTDSDLYGYVICDHMRALHVYMSALNGTCPLMGIPCFSYEDFLQGSCVDCEVYKRRCPTIGKQRDSHIAHSRTAENIPPHDFFITVLCSSCPAEAGSFPLDKSAEVEVTLRTWNEETEHRFRLQTATTVYRRVLAHPAALCQIDTIRLKNTGARLYRQGDLHIKSVCISELPVLRHEEPLCVNNINIRRGVPWSHDFVQVCGTL